MNTKLGPPAERSIPEAALHRRAQHLIESIEPKRQRSRSSRKLLGPAVLASAVIATTGAAWAYQQFGEATVTGEVRCYSMLKLGDGENYPGLTTTRVEWTSPQPPMTPAQAIEACSVSWRAGVLREGDAQSHEPYAPGDYLPSDAVPKLTVCVVEDRVAGVFPGGADSCAILGLPQLQP